MREDDLKSAEAMVERLHAGDVMATADLRALSERMVLEITQDLFIRLEPREALVARRLVIETFDHLMKQGTLDYRARETFYGFAAMAVRRILVDIVSRLENTTEEPMRRKIMETFQTISS